MRIATIVLACVSLLGCDGGPPAAIDAPAVAPDGAVADLTCAQLATQLQVRLAQTSTACSGPAECGSYGYPVRNDGFPTCDCGVAYASSCGGDAVNRAAWDADAFARALTDAWNQRCVPLGAASGAPAICDCSIGAISCVNQHCASSVHDCFADAGP